MLTPSKYWRIACGLDSETTEPPSLYSLPHALAAQTNSPKIGDGLVLAAYVEDDRTGLLRYLGLVSSGVGAVLTVQWKSVEAEIWVDTPKGHSYWKKGEFGFAATKITGYGLHAIFAEQFDGLELRQHIPALKRIPSGHRAHRGDHVAPERLNPMEVIGARSTGSRCGVVYVLKSAYGYKVGRTNNIPARMRAFGVHLPIVYTIPLCAWFDDCVVAEKRYHDMFQAKRINGEWFDLTDDDIHMIRTRVGV